MAVPLFDGNAMFGIEAMVRPVREPRRVQRNDYFGLDGYESLDGGAGGMVFEAEGQLWGTTPGNLALAEQFFDSYIDGRAYTLQDTAGLVWPLVRLVERVPEGPILSGEICSRRYRARFERNF